MEALKAMAKYSEAEDKARCVALALAFYAQRETNLSWPSDRELMSFARISKRQLHRALRMLEAAGEIHRHPRADGDPRRTYLIAPRDRHQLALPLEQGVTHDTFKAPDGTFPAVGEGAITDIEGATHTRAGSNHQNHQNNNPPSPPCKQGGDSPDLLSILQQTAQTPIVTAAVERVAGARRRRQRRRPDEQGSVASEPCPLHPHSDVPGPEPIVLEAWEMMQNRFRERLGGQWEIWGAGAHPHGARGGTLVIALKPEHAVWAVQRYGSVLPVLAGVPVSFVGCEQLAGAGQR
jgi:hypothetical protein